jgi:Zn-dependent protease with chaperone function
MYDGQRQSWLSRLLGSAWSILVVVAVVLAAAANLRSCFVSSRHSTTSATQKIQVSRADSTKPRHVALMSSMAKLWNVTGQPEDRIVLAIAESEEINAASFGRGRFVFWEGVADLPPWAIDAIAAHELAHDWLGHSRKAAELQDVTRFFSDILGLIGGASHEGQEVLSDWVDLAALPRYSRQQELEADREAVEFLRAVGYNRPAEVMASALRLLLDRLGDSGGNFFDSHPSTSERIEKLRPASMQ